MEGGTENKDKEMKENLYISNLSRFFILFRPFHRSKERKGPHLSSYTRASVGQSEEWSVSFSVKANV